MLLRQEDFFADNQNIAVEPRVPQCDFPEHYHNFHELVLVKSGTGIHTINDRSHLLISGMLLVIRDSDHHLYESVNNLHLTNILFDYPEKFNYLTNIAQYLPIAALNSSQFFSQNQTYYILNKDHFDSISRLIDQLNSVLSTDSTTAKIEAEMLFFQIALFIYKYCFSDQQVTARDDKGFYHLINWLNFNFHEEAIDWSTLAEQFSLSLRTIHRKMKEKTGLTPQRYLYQLRLLEARRQIVQTDNSITDIAYACGFSDSNHFSTLFKKEFSLSPRQLRTQSANLN